MVSPLLVLIVGLVSFFTPVRYMGFSELDHLTIDLVEERVYFAYRSYSDHRGASEWERLLRKSPPPEVPDLSFHYAFTFYWNDPIVLGLMNIPLCMPVPQHSGLMNIPLSVPVPQNVTYTVWLTEIDFPLWVLFVLLAVYPAVVFHRGPLRRRRRRSQMQCVACGYDLTANVSGICPECGMDLDELQRMQLAKDDRSV